MVAGFHVSLWSPSTISLPLALSQAVLPKISWLADCELQTLDWPVDGLPRTIHVDNAKEFNAEALVRGCPEYGIRLDHRPPGRPHFGGHIERLIGTMMGAVHLLPGTTFLNGSEKGSYASEERASLTLPELERWLALQIAGSQVDGAHVSSKRFTAQRCMELPLVPLCWAKPLGRSFVASSTTFSNCLRGPQARSCPQGLQTRRICISLSEKRFLQWSEHSF
jgi:transposase InsO family protein